MVCDGCGAADHFLSFELKTLAFEVNASTAHPSRRQFLLLLAIFLLPLLAACLLFYLFPQARPQSTVNYGQLVTPARPLPDLALRDGQGRSIGAQTLKGKWTLLYLAAQTCPESCQQRVFLSRQVRTALNKDSQRVQRVYLAPDAAALAAAHAAMAAQQPDLIWLVDTGGPGQRASDFFGAQPADALELIDPLGNWMMIYPPRDPPQQEFKGMLKDLKRLLRLSHIG
jgi:hypothetical protein